MKKSEKDYKIIDAVEHNGRYTDPKIAIKSRVLTIIGAVALAAGLFIVPLLLL